MKITLVVDNLKAAYTQSASSRETTGMTEVQKVAKTLGIPRECIDVVALTQADKVTDEAVKANLPTFFNDLRRSNPNVVVAMGASATKYLTGFGKLGAARGTYTNIQLPKKGFNDVKLPEDIAGLTITATSAPYNIFLQVAKGMGNGKSWLIEDLTGVWQKLNNLVRDTRCDYAWLESQAEIEEYFQEVERQYGLGLIPGLVIDVETNQHLDPFLPTAKLVAIGFSHKAWHGRAIKVHHREESFFSEWGATMWQWFVERFQKLLNRVPAGGWNFKFDIRWLRRHVGVEVQNVFFDGLLAHYAIYSELKPHDLKFAITDELGVAIAEAQMHSAMAALERAGYPKEDCHMGNIPASVLLTYLCGDVDSTFQLFQRLDPMIDDDHCWKDVDYRLNYPGFCHRPLYNDILLPAVKIFSEIEDNGIEVEPNMLKLLADTYPDRIAEALQPIVETPWGQAVVKDLDPKTVKAKGFKTLVTSYTNLSRLLYDEAKFPAAEFGLERKQRKSKDKTVYYYPTGKDVREKLLEWAKLNNLPEHAKLIENINKFSKLQKLHSGYITKMPKFIKGDGKMRTTYNLNGTRTGRASTSGPSLHTIPPKSDIKKIFVSRWHKQGGVILQADYSQLELRVIGAIANDPVLIEIFASGQDPHRGMATKIFNLPAAEITDDMRKKGKTINFGVLYGMAEESLAARTGMTVEEARVCMDNLLGNLKKVKKWIEKQKADVKARAVPKQGTGRKEMNDYGKLVWVDYQMEHHGYISTIFGRKRILKDAGHWSKKKSSKAERAAFNTPIQSAASDMAMTAVMRIHLRLKKAGLKSLLFGWIHDSIEIDVYPGEFFEVYRIVKEEMEETPQRLYKWAKRIPIKASAEVGHGWGYMTEMEYDTEKNVFTLKGDSDNIRGVLRAFSASYNISSESNEKGDKVTFTCEKKGSDNEGHEFIVQRSTSAGTGTPANFFGSKGVTASTQPIQHQG